MLHPDATSAHMLESFKGEQVPSNVVKSRHISENRDIGRKIATYDYISMHRCADCVKKRLKRLKDV